MTRYDDILAFYTRQQEAAEDYAKRKGKEFHKLHHYVLQLCARSAERMESDLGMDALQGDLIPMQGGKVYPTIDALTRATKAKWPTVQFSGALPPTPEQHAAWIVPANAAADGKSRGKIIGVRTVMSVPGTPPLVGEGFALGSLTEMSTERDSLKKTTTKSRGTAILALWGGVLGCTAEDVEETTADEARPQWIPPAVTPRVVEAPLVSDPPPPDDEPEPPTRSLTPYEWIMAQWNKAPAATRAEWRTWIHWINRALQLSGIGTGTAAELPGIVNGLQKEPLLCLSGWLRVCLQYGPEHDETQAKDGAKVLPDKILSWPEVHANLQKGANS